ncbi:hypothetical protein EMIT0111MI5_30455 [Burkholderia sp. IT-111MI5]
MTIGNCQKWQSAESAGTVETAEGDG